MGVHVSMFPFSGSDASFASNMKRDMVGKVSGITDEAIPAANTFVVKHFAADVTYTADNFVSRNNDALHHDLYQVPKASTSKVMLALFAKDAEAAVEETASTAVAPTTATGSGTAATTAATAPS